jgi:hypothetical protein
MPPPAEDHVSSRAPYVISIRHATADRCSRRPVSSSGAACQRGGDPPAAGGPEVDEAREFVTGQTLEMTGADLVVLALPGEGYRQLRIRHAARERRRPAPATECDLVLGPTSRGSPGRRGWRMVQLGPVGARSARVWTMGGLPELDPAAVGERRLRWPVYRRCRAFGLASGIGLAMWLAGCTPIRWPETAGQRRPGGSRAVRGNRWQ